MAEYMKQKQIKIYSFGRKNIKDSVITTENLEENIITLTESFLIKRIMLGLQLLVV